MNQKVEQTEAVGGGPPPAAPKPTPRKITGRGQWYALRDNVTRLYLLIAALAFLVGLVWLILKYAEWLGEDQLVHSGQHVRVAVYSVDTYRREDKRSRDQSGTRYAHFVFPVPGEERFRGTALLKTDELPAEGVDGRLRILRYCPPGDIEVYAVESQFKQLRDDTVAHRAVLVRVKPDKRSMIYHARAHPNLKRATAEYAFELPSRDVPLKSRGPATKPATVPATVRFTDSYPLSKTQELAEKSGRRTSSVHVRYLRANPHVQMAEPVMQQLIEATNAGKAKVVDGQIKLIEPVRGRRPQLELDDWREVTFEFPTGRTFQADDPEVEADNSLLGKSKRFEYGNVRLTGLEASDPMEGDLLDVYYDPQNPTRFVLHQVHKRRGRVGEAEGGESTGGTAREAEGHVVQIHGPQKLTTSLVLPIVLLVAGLITVGLGAVRLMHVLRIAREGKAVLATIVSVATSSIGLNSRRNFFRYQVGKRRRTQGSHTASIAHTGDLAEGDDVWVLVTPGGKRAAMIARVILPPDQFDDHQGEPADEPQAGDQGEPAAAKDPSKKPAKRKKRTRAKKESPADGQ